MDELREKVIYSIERCICHVPDACRDCSYDAGHPYNECVETMLKDVLFLLKAQEPVEPTEMINDFYPIGDALRTEGWKCGKCGQQIAWKDNYCSKCGTAVKWVE